jgi:hypothetical protein
MTGGNGEDKLDRLERLIAGMQNDMKSGFANIERLVVNIKESLEREIHDVRTEMNTRFDQVVNRLDIQAARLDRQGALIQTGSRWTTRMNEWSEKVDQSLEKLFDI